MPCSPCELTADSQSEYPYSKALPLAATQSSQAFGSISEMGNNCGKSLVGLIERGLSYPKVNLQPALLILPLELGLCLKGRR
jgi:hypothetical protein